MERHDQPQVQTADHWLPPAAVLLTVLGLVAALLVAFAPRAGATSPSTSATSPSSRDNLSLPGTAASGSSGDIEGFMTSVLTDVDAYWTRVLKDNGYSEPTVHYAWIPAGQSVVDACSNQPTDATAAFYCPNDDTIYLSESFAEAVRDGRMSQWPSGDQTDGALGDMAVAYVIAHEEGHNIQNELGWDQGSTSTEGLELDADCLAGAWAADAASRGVVNQQDLTEAKDTAWLVGDYAFDNPEHHGTPAQRQTAFTDGYTALSSCRQYLSD